MVVLSTDHILHISLNFCQCTDRYPINSLKFTIKLLFQKSSSLLFYSWIVSNYRDSEYYHDNRLALLWTLDDMIYLLSNIHTLVHKQMSIYNLWRFNCNIRSFNECFFWHRFSYFVTAVYLLVIMHITQTLIF